MHPIENWQETRPPCFQALVQKPVVVEGGDVSSLAKHFCSSWEDSNCAFSPPNPPQRETPKGRFSAFSRGLGSSFFSWASSTCLSAPWMYSAVPSNWLEVRTLQALGWRWVILDSLNFHVRWAQLTGPHASTWSGVGEGKHDRPEQLTPPPSWRKGLELSGSGGLSQEPGLELISAISPFYCTQILAGNCLTPFIWGSLLSRVWATASRRDQSLLLPRRRAHTQWMPSLD